MNESVNEKQVPELVQVVAAMTSENLMELWESIEQDEGPREIVPKLFKVHDPICSLLDSLKTMFACDAAQHGQEGFVQFQDSWSEKHSSVIEELREQFDRLAEDYGLSEEDNG
jgi:hypothetical protein